MDAELLIPIGVGVVAILAAIAAFTIAWRRSSSGPSFKVTRETRAADRSGPVDVPVATAGELADTVEPEAEHEPEVAPAAVAVATAQRVVEVTPEEAGVTRRSFLNRALGTIFLGGFLGGQALAFLSFLWPRVSGGFGADLSVGTPAELLAQAIQADGSIIPVFLPDARAYIVPAPTTLSAQFEGKSVAVEGVMAVYQRCVHLGCRVPWCATSQGFECPCHGSKYNSVGEYFAGPAPRNLDHFVLELSATGNLIIKTGTILETPRAIEKSVEYPKGPSCIGG